MPLTAKERLIVALDLPTPQAAEVMIERLAGRVGMFKVGSQLFTLAGPDFVRRLVTRGERVFLDLKYHDIPNTVTSAVTAARQLGVSLLDVHGLAGRAALEGAARALEGSATRLLAITVLTSHDETTLAELGLAGPIPEAVRRLARLAQAAGAHGVVASPHEVPLVREACGPDFLIVTPGIRPAGTSAGDQARLATPGVAVTAGASYIVVGRPILEAADPRDAADAIVAELATACGGSAD